MQVLSWILYSFALITFILIHQNVLEGSTIISVPVYGTSVTFGYPTLIYMLGIYIHIWSIYIEKNQDKGYDLNTLLSAFGFSFLITIVAFIVTAIIFIIENL
jgi:hypothetical protein